MVEVIPDSEKTHWVNRSPESIRPYLQLSRLDRPVGYWLLALPGWIGLAYAGLSHLLIWEDLKWAFLILIGAIAMRGAGCTYNDIVDQDLDAQVERTALRPLPAGTVTTKQAWIWLFMQCGIGLIVLLCLPRLAQIVSLFSIPLVAAYPFMKRITWWPQIWLGLTFNWAFLVAESIKISIYENDMKYKPIWDPSFSDLSFGFYFGLVFWTIGYDTIYACQDSKDDAIIGIKSTARKFGKRVRLGVAVCYFMTAILFLRSLYGTDILLRYFDYRYTILTFFAGPGGIVLRFHALLFIFPFATHLWWQIRKFKLSDDTNYLRLFKSNVTAAFILITTIIALYAFLPFLFERGDDVLLWPWETNEFIDRMLDDPEDITIN